MVREPDGNDDCGREASVNVDAISVRESEITSPLLGNDSSRDYLRQRSTRRVDVEVGSLGIAADPGSRILDRSGAFRQSRGRWSVHRQSRNPQNSRCCRGCFQGRVWNEWNLGGWFHRLAYQRTGVLMLILFLVYSAIVMSFGGIYLTVSLLGQTIENNPDGSERRVPFCRMEINNKMEALYMSLSTMASIGYGVSNYYFGECWTPLFLVLSQVCCAILFDAVAVGLLFHRISRGRKRSRTIAFSDKAVIKRVKGIPYLMFRMGELRKYHLMGATVRCYCVRHTRLATTTKSKESGALSVETTYFLSRQMKLVHPDQSFGSDVWMGLPQVIVHRIDEESPLVPPAKWYDALGSSHAYPDSSSVDGTENENDPLAPPEQKKMADLKSIEDFLTDRDAEIVVLVEGTDEGTGASTQARHSYKYSDIAWNHTFGPCIFPYGEIPHSDNSTTTTTTTTTSRRLGLPVCSIDFSRFHEIVSSPEDCEACAYVPI